MKREFVRDESVWTKTPTEKSKLKRAKNSCSNKQDSFSSSVNNSKLKEHFKVRYHKGNETFNMVVDNFVLFKLNEEERKGRIKISNISNEGFR